LWPSAIACSYIHDTLAQVSLALSPNWKLPRSYFAKEKVRASDHLDRAGELAAKVCVSETIGARAASQALEEKPGRALKDLIER